MKVLVANRSEIACRVMRACRRLGHGTVAVYSDPDAQALHVRMADEAIRLGPAPSSESYLAQDRILAAAAEAGADAIHPGYGFLSENADFARAVEAAGLTWIGPSPDAMDKMGDKVSARAYAAEAGVPVAPGSDALPDAEAAAEAASRIGYPVMLKAVGGGGGMGMRVVRDPSELEGEFLACRAQAEAAFGVPDVFMEKFIERPRHIEVQVLGDHKGHVVHLYERECSIQRRHQKLVEEAPSPALDDAAREEIGRCAVDLAKHVGYASAGTLEFLYEDGHFYFNEMNTRLQVEHPVTESVTGVDLVEWQLRIAAGEELSLRQEDIRLRGHAFEARINAEDPAHGFQPSPGPVRRLRLPTGPGIRTDHGIYEGWTVPSTYDSLVMKLITSGPDREAARQRMLEALDALELEGFTTNAAFHRALFDHATFQAGDLSTRFLEEHPTLGRPAIDERLAAQAVALVIALRDRPGGGLAGIQQAQRIPRVVARTPGQRDWRSA